MWSEFVVKPSESWRLDSPRACNLPGAARMQQADQAKCYQPSHLFCTAFPEGWKHRYFSICSCWLVPLLTAVARDFVLWIPACSRLPWKIPMQRQLSQRWIWCCWPELVFWLILNLPIHECLFLAVSLAGSQFQQPPPLPFCAFQTYLGKQSVVIRNAHVFLPGVTKGCSVALGILTIATTSIDRIWYSLNRLFVYLLGSKSQLQPELKHCQLNNAGLPS